ncbi:Polyketide cyclase / dehydrase and lipid transport [Micromonospora viridifaciens]|uniref:Polyketide cyclase / dehydrase and lipid transport n=2 Tax=Micromonospora viridifaciens TaxID=1881 RepID=A0A1C4XLD7_MICVI|nr:Polyketide cyclase / dehydrase and lipid transport [Micromonospora viridifaciens]
MGARSVTDALGIERATQDRGSAGLARFLGWFSLGLGVTALAAGPRISRLTGVDDSRVAPAVLRTAGIRELGHAAALLVPRRPGLGAWTRVAGDVLDLTATGQALRHRCGDRQRRLTYVMVALAGITAVDLYVSVRATRRRRGMTGTGRAYGSVTVNRTPEQVYGFWHDFENLPRFMYHVESVRMTGARRSQWIAKAPGGRSVRWEAEVIEDRPNQLIRWRSVDGARVPNSGVVRFTPVAGGKGTEVRVELEYAPPGRALGAAVARAFGEHPQQQIHDDLRRFKQVIETGEITRSDGTPDGTSIASQVKQRPAQPLATQRA